MGIDDAIYEIFGPLPQGAPGSDASTLRALDAVPGRDTVRQVLDLGVGRGRTTLTLAQALQDAQVTAVEIHLPFVEQVARHARDAGVDDRVQVVCGNMESIEIADKSYGPHLG